MLNIGAYDKRFIKRNSVKKPFKCSKNILDRAVPNHVLPQCSFKTGTTTLEKLEHVCEGVESLMEWTFERCGGVGNGNGRARATARKLTRICARFPLRLPVIMGGSI